MKNPKVCRTRWRPRGAVAVFALSAAAAGAAVLDFARFELPAGLYWNGSDGSGGFALEDIHFANRYTDWGDGRYSWFGFGLSSVEDTSSPGFGNQYAVYLPGKAHNHGRVYVVVSDDGQVALDLPYPATVRGFYINNTTYAALDMQYGSVFSRPFGSNDWFRLTVTGFDHDSAATGSNAFYLADFRSADTNDWHIQAGWAWFDLTDLGPRVRRLEFSLSSSDVGVHGMNTPAYFAMDRLELLPSPRFYAEEGLGEQRVFSDAVGGGNRFDAAVPGYVGPHGNGVATNAAPQNYANAAFGAWASLVEDYAPVAGVSAPFDDPTRALGPASANHYSGIVSLGDLNAGQIASNLPTGSITLGFDVPVSDGHGPDFAVFENGSGSASSLFAELAHVEVSTDGITFARFPSISLTPAPVGALEHLDPRRVHNLAGKHVNNAYSANPSWGTPFDLAELAAHPAVLAGDVDLRNIRFVRIVDVPGTGDFADALGQPIYDPWYTALPVWTAIHGNSGGFDLDAVGVLNSTNFHKIALCVDGPGAIHPYGEPFHTVSVRDGADIEFIFVPESGYYVADVRLDGVSLGPLETVTLTSVSRHRRLRASFGSRLIVRSPYGSSTPQLGTNYGYGATSVALTGSPVTLDGTQVVCVGWTADGSAPAEGQGLVIGPFELTNDTTVSWQWRTNFWLDVQAAPGGRVDAVPAWHPDGHSVTATAAADPYFDFEGWTGDIEGDPGTPETTVTMDRPRQLLAQFWAEMATNNVPVRWLAAHDLTNGTPDEAAMTDRHGKGMPAWQDFYAGTDPNDPDSLFAIVDFGSAYGSNYVVWLGGTNGSARPFSVLGSADLSAGWTVLDGDVSRSGSGTNTWWGVRDASNVFYRIEVDTGF